jgi:hypothetical protein
MNAVLAALERSVSVKTTSSFSIRDAAPYLDAPSGSSKSACERQKGGRGELGPLVHVDVVTLASESKDRISWRSIGPCTSAKFGTPWCR